MKVFNNPAVYVQSWYAVLPSRALRRGTAQTVQVLGRKITLFRDAGGEAHALDARCPHLGSDLGLGTVSGTTLRCRFHGWAFDGSGACAGSERRAVAYPVEERYGVIWIFNGPAPLFPLPAFDGIAFALKPQTIGCHPHVIAANGLDLTHFEPLHQMTLLEEPILEQPDAFRSVMSMRVRFTARGWTDRMLRALGGSDVAVTFTTYGGNMASIEALLGRVPVRVLFTHRPDGTRSHSRTFAFARRRAQLPLIFLVLGRIVTGDREILDRIDFRPDLADSDWPLAAFIRQVESMRTCPRPKASDLGPQELSPTWVGRWPPEARGLRPEG